MSARETVDDRIARMMKGVIDTHVHSGPAVPTRKLDHVELVRQASARGYAAVITKDQDYSGVATAALVRDNFPEFTARIYSGIVLNNAVGGFNPFAVEHTAAMGGRIVWFPTFSAKNHLAWEAAKGACPPAAGRPAIPLTPLTDAGGIRDDVKEILDIIAANAMVLASGHLHISEIWPLFEEAGRRGVSRLLVTHPEQVIDASLNDVKGLAAMGAYIEHSVCLFLDHSRFRLHPPEVLRQHIEAGGVERTILCSDLGQTGTIGPIEGMRDAIAMCFDLGYPEDAIRAMTSRNAARLFGLEELVS
jgi:hypothetical protein